MIDGDEMAKLMAARMGFIMFCSFVVGAVSWQLALFLYGVVAGFFI